MKLALWQLSFKCLSVDGISYQSTYAIGYSCVCRIDGQTGAILFFLQWNKTLYMYLSTTSTPAHYLSTHIQYSPRPLSVLGTKLAICSIERNFTSISFSQVLHVLNKPHSPAFRHQPTPNRCKRIRPVMTPRRGLHRGQQIRSILPNHTAPLAVYVWLALYQHTALLITIYVW